MWDLAKSLACGVTKGYLPMEHAVATLANVVLRDALETDDPATLEGRLRVFVWLLERAIDLRDLDRDLLENRITMAARRLLSGHPHRGRLRAEAFEINAQVGWMLRDDEIERVLIDELRRDRRRAGVAPPPPPAPRYRRRRYGR